MLWTTHRHINTHFEFSWILLQRIVGNSSNLKWDRSRQNTHTSLTTENAVFVSPVWINWADRLIQFYFVFFLSSITKALCKICIDCHEVNCLAIWIHSVSQWLFFHKGLCHILDQLHYIEHILLYRT